ncbi:hypothetical protein ABZ745_35075 [Streptomyces sp. NPDC013082]|uniref:hypothetical protein n=1 Tax=Streptomyces sp. NPDC013082 TaxID=3156686 RepID=UPI0033E45BAC
MVDFRTVVALICESTDDASARRIIAALIEWTGTAPSTPPTQLPADRENTPRPVLNERRALLRTELRERAGTAAAAFRPRDLSEWTKRHGRKRPWLQNELRLLTEEGFLQRDAHGSYTVRHPHRPA